MENLKIVRATPSEWEKFRDIRTLAVLDSPLAFGDSVSDVQERTEAEWKLWLEKPHVYAIQNNDIYVSMATLRLDPKDNVWCINGVWTSPEYRRLGLSKMLIETIFDKAKILNIKFLELSVTSTQESAISLYKKLGFEITNVLTGAIATEDEKYDQYVMRKYL